MSERRNRPWSAPEDEKLKGLYLTNDNTELGKLFDRTPDAIRKRLNYLKLKRPTKGEVQRSSKSLRTFLKHKKVGKKKKKQAEVQVRKEERKEKVVQRERDWAKKHLQTEKTVIIPRKPDETNRIPIKIGTRTIINVPAHFTPEQIDKVRQKYNAQGLDKI